MKKVIAISFVGIFHISFFIFAAAAQPISIAIKDSTRGIIRTDSSNWNEAWIEVGGSGSPKALTIEDISVTLDGRSAEVLSIDSIGAKYRSHLALSVVLDNSGSMFHSYDSLTKYCDSLVDSLPRGVLFQATTFDNEHRSPTHLPTRRQNLFIAQSEFTDSLQAIRSFWHYFDTIRTQFTPLYDAIAAAVNNISDRRMTLQDSSVDILLVVTDGEDNASRTSLESLRELLDALRIRLYAVNYRTEDSRLQWLVRHTHGQYYLADNVKELRGVLHGIGRLLTRQYYVRYRFPSLGPSGTPGRSPKSRAR